MSTKKVDKTGIEMVSPKGLPKVIGKNLIGLYLRKGFKLKNDHIAEVGRNTDIKVKIKGTDTVITATAAQWPEYNATGNFEKVEGSETVATVQEIKEVISGLKRKTK
jgi:hypothetical protein